MLRRNKKILVSLFSLLAFIPLISSCTNKEDLGTLENEWYKNDVCDTWVFIQETPASPLYATLRTDCNSYIKVYRYKKDYYERLIFVFKKDGEEKRYKFDKDGKNKFLTWTYNIKTYEKTSDYKCGCTGATQETCPNF